MPQLISSGAGDNEGDLQLIFPIGLVGVSQDGTDVYFSTYEELVPEDENGPFLKFYDARVNGGFLTPNRRRPAWRPMSATASRAVLRPSP